MPPRRIWRQSRSAACLPESREREFLADLASVSAWRLEDSNLHGDLTGGGTMVFTAASLALLLICVDGCIER